MTDGWTDQKRRTIINFLVNSPMGTFFLKSIDASSISKTTDKVFKMMDDIVEEVGEENVVQIVTDNVANYKLADKYHCIDLILEDFESKILMHKEIIASDKKITTYIYAMTGLITLLHHYTEGVTNKDFWKNLSICLKGAFPLLKVLRMVDSNEKEAMSYIYEAMDHAKEEIQTSCNNKRKIYQPLWKIIDSRWDKQLHRPLHVAGYYLNTMLHYKPNFKEDNEVKQVMHACLERMTGGDMNMVNKIDGQLEDFKSKKEFFGSEIAQRGLKNKTPTQWLKPYGDAHPELQNFAICVLSLTRSSFGCERNWSVHTKKRNRLKQNTMNDLVYAMYIVEEENASDNHVNVADLDEDLMQSTSAKSTGHVDEFDVLKTIESDNEEGNVDEGDEGDDEGDDYGGGDNEINEDERVDNMEENPNYPRLCDLYYPI
ncbi:uncharacterized protein LOC127095008 [Lathyrus oleraceus]|uniref:uncharacterized protein LOC127095008 n=1 Tax=Pisum sativum TaxID=3888 RepID=UPI0021CE6E09|nr:uncharacterized protein LOC127095008 [Pisum sativum]